NITLVVEDEQGKSGQIVFTISSQESNIQLQADSTGFVVGVPGEHEILGDYLKQSGYGVLHAKNGAKGLEMLKLHKPELLLLDIQMPVMDGFQALKKIREIHEFKNTQVILLSSLNREFLKQKGMDLGADDYIAKPFGRGELLTLINLAFRRTEQSRSTEGIMKGDLSDLGLPDLLQSMELGTKTASIFLKDADGEIHIQEGSLIHVRQGNFIGDKALLRIFLFEKGVFTVKFNEIPKNISGTPVPLMSILMENMAGVDEIRDIINRMQVGSRMLEIQGNISEFPAINKFKELFPISFTELMVHMEDHLKNNIKILISALRKGVIRLV
ncbi:response regulator, partial [Desulfobacterales bacterium HSG17]|nr:response regulator [Desulfobacterales bacterium HSG17]